MAQNKRTLLDEIALDKSEWLESIEYIYKEFGVEGVKEILSSLEDHIHSKGIEFEKKFNTPYINTISTDEQPVYPGNLELEKRIENIIRWNAMAIVLRAQDEGAGVGGHIATYASTATIMEVGFNHFFRKKSKDYGGDLVLPQPHGAPGIYARAYMEGRLKQTQLVNYRRQLRGKGGLSSYPHPRAMPDFWQVPNASMGLSTAIAIYQAKFTRYLENRGLKQKNGGKVWCFIGDGETDEPEVLGTINAASREKLDNLILVVNCNLQRLDGPVRGSGKIIQELERSFSGSGWNVIKVIWGTGWDSLLAKDSEGILRKRMKDAVDGDYQYYSVSSGNIQREHWVQGNPELKKIMDSLTDEELKAIPRGGQDPKKIYAAFAKASQSTDKPTVILIKTVKGDSMGPSTEGKNTAHQKKNLSPEERVQRARKYGIDLDEAAMQRADFYLPGEDSAEMQYLQERRQALGGYLPVREFQCDALPAPDLALFKDALKGTGERAISTTSSAIRILAQLLKDPQLGKYIVPIVPDEARTFGMEGLFNIAGIFSQEGQNYTPVDAGTLTAYKETVDGQILQEGICETGAMASFLAAGTAYAIHGLPMIPFYFFYSMFGFQRVGDMIWSCGDMMCKGFLLGGTAGRTTLNGEGLQHQDGHSHVVANTIPNMKSYDPAFAYELAVIVKDGIRRMYQQNEDLFYYITLYNENYAMPPMPEDPLIEEGILKGAYCFKRSAVKSKTPCKINLLASGSIFQQAISAAEELEKMGFDTDIYSITSFNELYREAIEVERKNMLGHGENTATPYITSLFEQQPAVFVAVSDYMKSLPNSIAQWLPGPVTVLGTDGYGVSESREDLRDYFEISPKYIVAAAVQLLYRMDFIKQKTLLETFKNLDINADKHNPAH